MLGECDPTYPYAGDLDPSGREESIKEIAMIGGGFKSLCVGAKKKKDKVFLLYSTNPSWPRLSSSIKNIIIDYKPSVCVVIIWSQLRNKREFKLTGQRCREGLPGLVIHSRPSIAI